MIEKYREIYKVLQDLGYGDKAKIVDIVPEIVFCWLCNYGYLEAAKMLYAIGDVQSEIEERFPPYITYCFESESDKVEKWLDSIIRCSFLCSKKDHTDCHQKSASESDTESDTESYTESDTASASECDSN